MRIRLPVAASLAFAMVAVACSSGGGKQPAEPPAPPAEPPAGGETAVIAAVGDLVCAFGTKQSPHHAPAGAHGECEPEKVAKVVKSGDYDAFLPLGDLQYSYGAYWRYLKYWDRYYGSVKDITRPVPGNHEYYDGGAHNGYYTYFGKRAYPPRGYYSYDLGDWHMIALNTQRCINKMWDLGKGWTNPMPGGGCQPGDPMYEWLKRDLARHPNDEYACTLAYFHQPMFKIVTYELPGNNAQQAIYELLYKAGVDVALTGHQHDYQRWVPMNPQGSADPNGMAQFVVGTGGNSYQPLPDESEWPETVAAANTGTYGVLKMTLSPASYDFEFLPAAGQAPFEDSGSESCH